MRKSGLLVTILAVGMLGVTPFIGNQIGNMPYLSQLKAESQAQETKFSLVGPGVRDFTLDNGLQVVVIPDRRAPVVTHMLWYRVGSADEPKGKSGIAHYLEHLLFKGTTTYKNNEFSNRISAMGGQENAFTTTDYTGYYQRVSPDALEEMMHFEADRMENLVLTEKVVLPERSVILEERRSRIENNPGAKLGEAVMAALYQNHPYGTPIIGWKHEMLQLGLKDAVDFYDRYYTPNNAVLIVAGDVEADAVKAMAERTYGKVKRRAEPGKRMRPQEPEPRAHRTVEYSDPLVTNEQWQRHFLAPSYTTDTEGEAEALDILSEVIAGSSTSRIYRKLVVEEGVASNAGGYYQGSGLDQTRFMLYATPRDGKTLEDVEKSMDAVIADVKQNGVTEEEIKRAKNRILKSLIFSQDSQTNMARIFGAAIMSGQSIDDLRGWVDLVTAVTPEQVQAVAKKYLKKERAVTGYLRLQKERS